MICAGQVTGVQAGVVGGLQHTPPLGTSTSILVTTGWRLISEIKYGLTVTLICVLVTFQAYWGLTRCAPFDKICLSNFLDPF